MRQLSVIIICLIVVADLGMIGQALNDRAINWEYGIPIIVGNFVGIAFLFVLSRAEQGVRPE